MYGAATLAFGLTMLVWHQYDGLAVDRSFWSGPGGRACAYALAAAQIIGGIAMPVRRTARAGALLSGSAYLVFAGYWVHAIAGRPLVYDLWGNFFEQLSLALGAALIYASRWSWKRPAHRRFGCIVFGACAASFAVQQARHLDFTASLVPKWLPPSPYFWSVATTAAFAIAALALFADRFTLWASRLTTVMLGSFGIVVWLPQLVASPRDLGTVGETIETFGITGTAWILYELIADRRGGKRTLGRVAKTR